jgi:hypothetical protein
VDRDGEPDDVPRPRASTASMTSSYDVGLPTVGGDQLKVGSSPAPARGTKAS